MSELDKETTIKIKRRTSSKLQILKQELHYSSVDTMLNDIMVYFWSKGIKREDLTIIEVGTAKNEKELAEKTGKPEKTLSFEQSGKVESDVKKGSK